MLELLLGPVTGLIGSAVSGITSYFERQQEMEKMKLAHSHELALFQKEAELRDREMSNEIALAEIRADREALRGSYQEAASQVGETYRWVIAVLKLTRPTLTAMLAIGAISLAAIHAQDMDLIDQVIYLAGVAIGWWFGDRRKTAK